MCCLTTFFLVVCFSFGARAGVKCQAEQLEESVRKNLGLISNYQVASSVSLGGAIIESEISGTSNRLLRVDMSILQGDNVAHIKMVFDGTFQWVETSNSSSVEVLRVKLSELVTPLRPFDTSYYLMGSGLLNGEDLPASINTLLSIYDLTAVCEGDVFTLSGELNEPRFANYVSGKRLQGSLELMVRTYAEKFGQLLIKFDMESLALKEYRLGPIGEPAVFHAQFTNLKVNNNLSKEHFIYNVSDEIQAVDITDELLLRLKVSK